MLPHHTTLQNWTTYWNGTMWTFAFRFEVRTKKCPCIETKSLSDKRLLQLINCSKWHEHNILRDCHWFNGLDDDAVLELSPCRTAASDDRRRPVYGWLVNLFLHVKLQILDRVVCGLASSQSQAMTEFRSNEVLCLTRRRKSIVSRALCARALCCWRIYSYTCAVLNK